MTHGHLKNFGSPWVLPPATAQEGHEKPCQDAALLPLGVPPPGGRFTVAARGCCTNPAASKAQAELSSAGSTDEKRWFCGDLQG